MRASGAFDIAVACEVAIIREEATLLIEAEMVRLFGAAKFQAALDAAFLDGAQDPTP